jgi:hypothetical protein
MRYDSYRQSFITNIDYILDTLLTKMLIFKFDGVAKSPIYCVAAYFEILDYYMYSLGFKNTLRLV